jgi:hypothetical protein
MAKLLWTLKQRIGPAPRAGHSLAFDERRRRVVLFGGGTLQAGQFFGDTWEWDGEHWTQMDDIGPSPRWRHALVYDAPRQRIILFAGQGAGDGGDGLSDTWEWDGEHWTYLALTGPAPRYSHSMVFDAARNQTILFGGASGANLLNDTWEWNGEEWVQLEDTGPAPRREHAMSFDAARGRVVLFGGTNGSETFGDTWEWDGSAWRQTSSFGPPPASAAALAGPENRVLLFGGIPSTEDGAAPFGETWEWDGRHWTIRQDIGPAPRWDHAMVHDPVRRRTVLFGGVSGETGGTVTPLSDTWEQFERGAQVPPPPPPPPGEVALQSFTITPPIVEEGRAFMLELQLTGPAAQSVEIQLRVTEDGGGAPIESTLPIRSGETSLSFPVQGGLFPGAYTFTGSLGSSERSATLQVVRHTSLTLATLEVEPDEVAPDQAFTIRVTLSAPVAGEALGIPLRLSLENEPPQPFGAVPVSPGSSSGSLTVDLSVDVRLSAVFTATLGGVERSANVQFTG